MAPQEPRQPGKAEASADRTTTPDGAPASAEQGARTPEQTAGAGPTDEAAATETPSTRQPVVHSQDAPTEPPDAIASGVGHEAVPKASPVPAAMTDPVDDARPADPFEHEARGLVQAWERELAAEQDPSAAARLHYEIARLYEYPLHDLRRAAANYQGAVERAPEHVPSLRGARRVLMARGHYAPTLPLFDAEARIASDPSRKAALYYAKGRLLEDALEDRDGARAAYAAALELDRDEPSILKALEQCDRANADWQAVERTYEREANAVSSDPRHRAALVAQRARLAHHKRGQADVAIELYETALRLDPTAAGALSALKQLHHMQRRWRDLIKVLDMEARQTTDPGVRTMAFYRMGRLHADRLGNRNEAISALEQAAEATPNDPLVLTELAHLYESVERWDSLATVLERLAATTSGADQRVGVLERLGQLLAEKLSDEDGAVRWYEEALSIQPTYVPALQALGPLYAQREQWVELVQMHRAEAEATDDTRKRASAHARIAEIYEVHLGKAEEATEHHVRALAQVPGYAPSFKALSRLYADAGQWRKLVELYERAVDQSTSPEQAIAYLLRIGDIYEESLREPKQAVHAYRRVLNLDASHLGAIHALQRACERAGRHQDLVEGLELEAEKTHDAAQVVVLIHRAGEVLDEQLGDREAAITRFRKVLTIDPRYVPALTSLGRIFHRSGRWEDLLEMYRRELELTAAGPTAISLLHKMGELCEERIGRDDEALVHYRRAIDMNPSYSPSLRALSRKLREREQWQDLVKVLELELSTPGDAMARARTSFRIGEVYEEQLSQTDLAVSAYEEAHRCSPGYRPAIDAISRIRAKQKSWTKLVVDLQTEADTAPDAQLAAAALIRQGEIWAEELDDDAEAIKCYARVAETMPDHVGALLALERLYRKTEAWALLAQNYGQQAGVLTDTGARIAALRERVRIQEGRPNMALGSPRDTYRAILELSHSDVAALEGLERLALVDGDRATLAALDGQLCESADDASTRAAYLARQAESLEVTDDSAGALEAYRAALSEDPDQLGATRGLSRLAEKTDDPFALAEAARREASAARDSRVAARLLVRSAVVRSMRLGDSEGALKDLERALELCPDHTDAADELTTLLLRAQDEARLSNLLARAADSAKEPARIAALWLEVARIQADLLGNLPGAISALNRVLRTVPDHVATLQRLAELYGRDGQWTETVNLLSRVVQLAPDREVVQSAHLQLAEIWDERLGETARAMVSLQAALALDPHNQPALVRLCDAQTREGRITEAAKTAGRLLDSAEGPVDRAVALVRLSRIERARGNEEAGLAALFESVELAGPNHDGATELMALITDTDLWRQYADALRAHIDTMSPGAPMDPAPVFIEVARVLDAQLGDRAGAITALHNGIEQASDKAPLRTKLAALLSAAGDHDDAVVQLCTLLGDEPAQSAVWRDLARTFETMGREAEVRLAVMPLAVLGDATNVEVDYLAAHGPRAAHARAQSLGPHLMRSLGPAGEGEDAACDLLLGLVEGLPKLFPADLEAYGLSNRDRISKRSTHPIRSVADRIADIVGVEDYGLFVHRVRTRGVEVELSNPPALLVPATVSELAEPEQVFLIAAPLIAIAHKLHAVYKLTPRELEVLLASAARQVSPSYGSGLTNEDYLDEQKKRIYKALPRRARKPTAAAAQRYVDAPRPDFVSWAEGLTRASQRIAAIFADDLPTCVDVLRRTEPDMSELRGHALVQASPPIAELLRFWLSDQAIEIRRAAGMLPSVDPHDVS